MLLGAGASEELTRDTADGDKAFGLAAKLLAILAAVDVANGVNGFALSWDSNRSAGADSRDGGKDLGDLHIGGWFV